MDREACLRQVSLSEMPALYRSMQDNRKEMDMFTSFLIKYAEIGVKGKNRYLFEDALVKQIRHALKKCDGEFQVRKTDGRIYVDAVSAFDFEDTVEMLKKYSAFPVSVRLLSQKTRDLKNSESAL